NRAAFVERLSIALEAPAAPPLVESVQGLNPFGLLDERKARFVNISRSYLPLDSYRLVSLQKHRLEGSTGWNLAAEHVNQGYELEDGTECFVSYLWPTASRATLLVNGQNKIDFGRRQRINLRVYSGSECRHALKFLLK